MNEASPHFMISVFPNPSNLSTVNIEINSDILEMGNISIYDSAGRIIQEKVNQSATNLKFSFNNLPSGFYIARFVTQNGSTRKSFVIL